LLEFDAGATQQRIRRFRNDSNCASLNHLLHTEFCEWRFSVENRRPSASRTLPRLHRSRLGDLDREGAVRRPLDSRDQVRRLPRPDPPGHEAIRIFTRRGHDWTKRFGKIANDVWHIKAGSAIIDGEIVVPAADGTTDFSVLQNELKGPVHQYRPGRVRPALPRLL
jgi:hypothetical protein